ncbi:LOW QUALITY PROTEIN: C-X-C chemokine receptor type 6 [Acridotheres tristis]
MATIDTNFYCNSSITDPYENRNENFQLIRVFLPHMYFVVFILGLARNALVFVILSFYTKLKILAETDVLLLNVAIGDWVFLWMLPLWVYSAAQEWTSGTVACHILMGLVYTSLLTLMSITSGQLIPVTFATKAQCQTKRMTQDKLISVLIWVISQAFAAPYFVLGDVSFDKAICQEEFPNYHTELVLDVIQVTLAYFIPMLALIICYSLIIKIVLCARSLEKKKSIKIFPIVVLFILIQIPYTFFRFIKIIHWSFKLNSSFEYAITVTKTLAYFYGCLNPYFFTGMKIRKYHKIIKKSRSAKQVTAQQWQTPEEEDSKPFTALYSADATSMYPL